MLSYGDPAAAAAAAAPPGQGGCCFFDSPPNSSSQSLPPYYYFQFQKSSSTQVVSLPHPTLPVPVPVPPLFSSYSSSCNFPRNGGGDLQACGENSSSQGQGGAMVAGTGRVGRYSAEERKERIQRYRSKRNQRNFHKKITYACRKSLADGRPRVRGRFARNAETEAEASTAETSYDYYCSSDYDEDVLANLLDVFYVNPSPPLEKQATNIT